MTISRREFLGLAAFLGLSGCARKEGKGLLGGSGPPAFAAINDLHVLDARSTGIVNRAVQQINADPSIVFTVVLGDLCTDGKHREMQLAKGSLDRLDRPYFCVPGNHDVELENTEVLGNYTAAFGDAQWREKDEGWVFMGINTCNGTASEVTMPETRMAWIEKKLKRIGEKRPIALFAHHPFNPNTKAYRVGNADEVLSLFDGHNLKLVAAGHYHGNQVETRDGVLFTTTACCSTTRDNFDGAEAKGYRRFVLRGGELEHEFVEVRA